MLNLKIPDMTCGHCAGVVTKAVQSVDAGADITVDLKTRTVAIDSKADPLAITDALEVAGYSAEVGVAQ